ncbi:MAG: PAC2 family protein [Chloroflexi bacterium]|nr:MAG: PAC2 family protein [Chloroflexota bacterium]
MHEVVRTVGEIRPLRDPVLLAAFTGFTDTHGSAVAAVRYLAEQWNAQPLATIESERFYDFTVQRPRVHLENNARVVTWPENAFSVASPPGVDRDFLLFTGIEPHLRWKTFIEAMEDVLQAVGCTTSITLASQPAAVPHTRPLPVTLSASHPEFEQIFRLKAPVSRYQGTTGIVGILNLHLRTLGGKNASLWALTPHYLTIGPNPNVGASLVEYVDLGFGTTTARTGLKEQSVIFGDQVREALEESSDVGAYIRQLEEQYDMERPSDATRMDPADAPGGSDDLPSSDELLEDLERFLRDQQGDQPGGSGGTRS